MGGCLNEIGFFALGRSQCLWTLFLRWAAFFFIVISIRYINNNIRWFWRLNWAMSITLLGFLVCNFQSIFDNLPFKEHKHGLQILSLQSFVIQLLESTQINPRYCFLLVQIPIITVKETFWVYWGARLDGGRHYWFRKRNSSLFIKLQVNWMVVFRLHT